MACVYFSDDYGENMNNSNNNHSAAGIVARVHVAVGNGAALTESHPESKSSLGLQFLVELVRDSEEIRRPWGPKPSKKPQPPKDVVDGSKGPPKLLA